MYIAIYVSFERNEINVEHILLNHKCNLNYKPTFGKDESNEYHSF